MRQLYLSVICLCVCMCSDTYGSMCGSLRCDCPSCSVDENVMLSRNNSNSFGCCYYTRYKGTAFGVGCSNSVGPLINTGVTINFNDVTPGLEQCKDVFISFYNPYTISPNPYSACSWLANNVSEPFTYGGNGVVLVCFVPDNDGRDCVLNITYSNNISNPDCSSAATPACSTYVDWVVGTCVAFLAVLANPS